MAINSVNAPQPLPQGRRTLEYLARLWKVQRQDIFDAVDALGIRAPYMASKVSPANERRLDDYLHRQTPVTRAQAAVPVGMPNASSKRGSDKTAYLTASDRSTRMQAAERADVDLCSCCEIPLPAVAQSGDLCGPCLSAGHRDAHGPDRDRLDRAHADRFRADYLREQSRAALAESDRQAANDRADRWRTALVRTVVDHNRDGKHCPLCHTPAPCAVWQRLERANPGIHSRVLNDFYPLSAALLDQKLADGIDSSSDD